MFFLASLECRAMFDTVIAKELEHGDRGLEIAADPVAHFLREEGSVLVL